MKHKTRLSVTKFGYYLFANKLNDWKKNSSQNVFYILKKMEIMSDFKRFDA